MKKFLTLLIGFLLISIMIYSCTFIGVDYYYKSDSDKWLDIGGYEDSVLYGNNNEIPIIISTCNDTFKLYSIKVSSIDYSTNYAFGLVFIPVLPDIITPSPCNDENHFYLIIKIDVFPITSIIKYDDVRFYINGEYILSDSIETAKAWRNSDYFGFKNAARKVKNVKIEFKNVTINGTKIEIPDLILVRDWRFYDTINLSRFSY